MNTAAQVAAGFGVILAAIGAVRLLWWGMGVVAAEPGRHRHHQPRPTQAARPVQRWVTIWTRRRPVVNQDAVRGNAAPKIYRRWTQ